MKFLAGFCLVLGVPVLGAYLGASIGEAAFCHDDEYAILRCMGESLVGALVGGFAGLIAVFAVGVTLLTRNQGRE